jgi:hypothetical protein
LHASSLLLTLAMTGLHLPASAQMSGLSFSNAISHRVRTHQDKAMWPGLQLFPILDFALLPTTPGLCPHAFS